MQPLSESQMESLETAVQSYQDQFMADAARYLLSRGVDRELATTFRLGVVTDPVPGHGRFRGMLAIPYLDKDGHPLTIRFRCLQQHDHRAAFHGKYNSMAEDPSRVFNIKAIFDAKDEIHIAEGEFDAMILTKVGLPAVAIPGAHGWQYHHRRMLAGFSRVYVWGDPDDAGAEFVTKVVASMRAAKGVGLKVGDVTETYLQGGAEALYALIKREVKQ
jgi:DNA primase